MIPRVITLLLVVWLTFSTGCKSLTQDIDPPNYNRPLPPGALGLRKITDPAEIPNFTPGSFDLYQLNDAIANSLNFLSKPSSQNFFPYDQITHENAVASLAQRPGHPVAHVVLGQLRQEVQLEPPE